MTTTIDTRMTRPIGDLLREWRERRRLSQLALALDAEVSTRHLSFVETGRALPSRDMVLHLAEQLDVPLRERNRMLLAAGFAPELAASASCGERADLGAFSASAGGVVCPGCEAGSFGLDQAAHTFLVEALGRPLAEHPSGSEPVLRQADRAIAETLEHHAHVRLRRVAA